MEGGRIMAFDLSQYETVDERLHKWWGLYPDGRVETEVIEATNVRFIVVCRLFKTEADLKPCATGLASETVSDRGVNANFALPNCETSAIGRAISNSGLSAKGKRPSREEMASVNAKEAEAFKPKYGRPGSKSAAMEHALHIVNSQPKDIANEPVPLDWSVGESITQIGEVVNIGFTCRHGNMVKKEGIAKGTNKPYAGYVCSAAKPDQCDAKWAKLTAAGTWYWPDDTEPGKGGE
jgi:hypothetical protein